MSLVDEPNHVGKETFMSVPVVFPAEVGQQPTRSYGLERLLRSHVVSAEGKALKRLIFTLLKKPA